jgi:SAM-dependent methyltransferase
MQYYESPVYGEWCKRVYGQDLKQMGVVTMAELAVFFREVDVLPDSHILDMGCGPGYLSAAVAEHYHSQVTGIDIDEGVISHARKTFSDHPKLNFQCADGNRISFAISSFDLIYFFDTLYFTGSTEKLHTLLDTCLTLLKPGGKLAIFWSNHPATWFGIQAPAAGTTPVGKWGMDHNVPVKAVDLTEAYRRFWLKAMKEVSAMATELRKEIPETTETLMDECPRYSKLCEKGDAGGMFRWLYIFSRPCAKDLTGLADL